MRILFLALDIDISGRKGDTIHVVELASALASQGHKVALVVGAQTANPPDLDEGIWLQTVSGSFLSIVRKISGMALQFKPDAIYERRLSPKIGFTVGRLARIPVALEANGLLDDELSFQGRAKRGFLSRVKGKLRGMLLRRVDAFVVVSDKIRDDLIQKYRVDSDRVRVIGNGVNLALFMPEEKQDACAKLGLPADRFRLVFVGNIVGWRDFDSVLKAVRLLAVTFADIEFLVVGSGQDDMRLRASVATNSLQDRVRLTGEVPHREVPSYICAADLAVLPERPRALDISPLKLFEYMACERPVVGFDVAGLSLVDEEEAGKLVFPGDAAALAKETEELLRDEARRTAMGRRGRAYVSRERSWNLVAARIVSFLESRVRAKA